jgi:ribosome biogenesis GTPase
MKRRGLVIARHRRELVIEDEDEQTMSCLLRGRKIRPLTGDEVLWQRQADGTTVIERVLPRRTVLERIDSRGRAEGVAANVSLLLVVIAPRPAPDWELVDRYLVAAELMGIDAVLVRNKRDLADSGMDRRAAAYADLGYAVIQTSVTDRGGLDALGRALSSRRGVLLGQSGVGKSSLINALLESDLQAVGDLSGRKGLGRHTTTAAILYRLPRGGELIDSPGVRRYATKVDEPAMLERGFREFRAYLGQCRFSDCRHMDEPGCAVRGALEQGEIEPARYRSYRTFRATLERL